MEIEKLVFYFLIAQMALNGAQIYLVPVTAFTGELKPLTMILVSFNFYMMFKYNYVFHELLEKWGIKK